ncbi:hypothetical protein [Veillonella magna]|uniref:hypothetical protein n=1 Tax=Veillonella magna TaxID=464322 RepID=UPI0023F2926C|nr:hypothetical protein [Veillonella magna]
MIKARRCEAKTCLNNRDGTCKCHTIRLDHKGRCREWCVAEITMKDNKDVMTKARG